MDVDGLTRWLGAIALILSIGNTLWVWLSKGGRDLAHKIRDLREELLGSLKEVGIDIDEHDSRIQEVESELKHLPSKEDVARLTVAVTEINGKLGAFDVELTGIARTVRRIDDYLRDKAS